LSSDAGKRNTSSSERNVVVPCCSWPTPKFALSPIVLTLTFVRVTRTDSYGSPVALTVRVEAF